MDNGSRRNRRKDVEQVRKKQKIERGRPLPERISSWLHTTSAHAAMIIAVGFLILCVIFFTTIAPRRYTLTVGSISHQTITATQSVVDEITTEEKRKAAAANIEPTYHLDESAAIRVMENLQELFDELSKVQQYGLTVQEIDEEGNEIAKSFSNSEIEYAQKLVTHISLTRYQATVLMTVAAEEFDIMVTNVTRAVQNALNSGIREGKVSDAISTVQQIVGFSVDLSLMQVIVPTVLRTCIEPNMVIDQEATEQARQKAMENVEYILYLPGQNIIREGEVVTSSQYAMVKTLGLLEDDTHDYSSYFGVAIFLCFGIFVLVVLIRIFRPMVLHDVRFLSVEMAVIVVTMLLTALSIKLIDPYLALLPLGSILIGALLGWRAAMPASVCMAVINCCLSAGSTTITLHDMLVVSIMSLVAMTVSALYLRGKGGRLRPLICGVLVGVTNMILMMAFGLMAGNSVEDFLSHALWSGLSGVLSGMLSIGLQPLLESAYNLATPAKLLELGNPNHPLLRRLLMEAPGTYHHSIIVANLAEAAAEKIGANALLARTGAYFHDVGKLKRPSYFKENQQGINPLDQTDPYVSAAIVTTHTRDGLQLAQKYHLPPEIQDIIIQHHGDTPVMFFYHRALEQAGGREVDIADFRYDGTRPTTKEAAIVMFADTIEAAVRSMKDPSPKDIREFIQKLIQGKLQDGQLNNSPITLRDIEDICDAFCTVLNGVFHERIEYPEVKVPSRTAETGKAKESSETPGTESSDIEEKAEHTEEDTGHAD